MYRFSAKLLIEELKAMDKNDNNKKHMPVKCLYFLGTT